LIVARCRLERNELMFRKNKLTMLVAWSALAALPAFSQEEACRQEVSGQALGSFVKETTQEGIQQKATNTGGALAGYRYFFGRHDGVEASYAYSLKTQTYNTTDGWLGVKAYSNPATAAYVWKQPFNRWSFFTLAGTSAIIFDPRNTHGLGYQGRPADQYGAGIDADITGHLFVRAQYRGLVYNSPTYDLPVLAGPDRITHRFEPSVGFGWRF
jgi:opacity protein-like surface antigen